MSPNTHCKYVDSMQNKRVVWFETQSHRKCMSQIVDPFAVQSTSTYCKLNPSLKIKVSIFTEIWRVTFTCNSNILWFSSLVAQVHTHFAVCNWFRCVTGFSRFSSPFYIVGLVFFFLLQKDGFRTKVFSKLRALSKNGSRT